MTNRNPKAQMDEMNEKMRSMNLELQTKHAENSDLREQMAGMVSLVRRAWQGDQLASQQISGLLTNGALAGDQEVGDEMEKAQAALKNREQRERAEAFMQNRAEYLDEQLNQTFSLMSRMPADYHGAQTSLASRGQGFLVQPVRSRRSQSAKARFDYTVVPDEPQHNRNISTPCYELPSDQLVMRGSTPAFRGTGSRTGSAAGPQRYDDPSRFRPVNGIYIAPVKENGQTEDVMTTPRLPPLRINPRHCRQVAAGHKLDRTAVELPRSQRYGAMPRIHHTALLVSGKCRRSPARPRSGRPKSSKRPYSAPTVKRQPPPSTGVIHKQERPLKYEAMRPAKTVTSYTVPVIQLRGQSAKQRTNDLRYVNDFQAAEENLRDDETQFVRGTVALQRKLGIKIDGMVLPNREQIDNALLAERSNDEESLDMDEIIIN